MAQNILICGVGGQGTVLAAKVISQAALAEGKKVLSSNPSSIFALLASLSLLVHPEPIIPRIIITANIEYFFIFIVPPTKY